MHNNDLRLVPREWKEDDAPASMVLEQVVGREAVLYREGHSMKYVIVTGSMRRVKLEM